MATLKRAACALAWISLALGLTGCASPLPEGGRSMAEIFEEHRAGMGRIEPAAPKDQRGPGLGEVSAYTRSAGNELELLFPKLRNPDLIMFTYPHDTAEGAPVPGYTTGFPLYERDHLALPGEEGL